MRTDDFDYELPDGLIAQHPLDRRDAARLLRVPSLTDHFVADLPRLLRPGDVVVVNTTRVRAARLYAARPTGGVIEVLLLSSPAEGIWEALVRPARKLQAGDRLSVTDEIELLLLDQPEHGIVRVELSSAGATALEDQIAKVGEMPLPPYIKTRLDDPERYQTMFADVVGSAAAPTAGLHFTPELVESLADAGIELAKIELRVGLDTFRPITVDEVTDHEIHSEWCAIDAAAAEQINACRARGGRVVAVGTTVARTLESFAGSGSVVGWGEQATNLYITPGYRFRVVDVLMTNFHVPRSSLLVMVAAFIGDAWRAAYQVAIQRGYRFLSFGDATLLERADG